MPITLGETALFEAECSIQECDTLLEALQQSPPVVIDLRSCQTMHTALFQLLIAAGERTIWPPDDENLRQLLGVRLKWSDAERPSVPLVLIKSGARRKKETA